jgi:hypothetical protein
MSSAINRKSVMELLPMEQQGVPWTTRQLSNALGLTMQQVSEALNSLMHDGMAKRVGGSQRAGVLWMRTADAKSAADTRGKHGNHPKGKEWQRKHRAARPTTPQHGAQFRPPAKRPAVGLEAWPRVVVRDDGE